MNKYFASLSITTTLLLGMHMNAAAPFEKLTPYITQSATEWIDEFASSLGTELQLTYLNLFAFNAPESIKQFIQCAQFIETNEAMLPSYEALSLKIMDLIKRYIEPIQKKIDAKKSLTDKEKETIIEKLQIKIKELITHINATFYQKLYNHVAKSNAQALIYSFDTDGIIPQEKRTKRLPASL